MYALFYFFKTHVFSASISFMTNAIDDKFLQPYDATTTESRIYKMWEESGYFNPDVCIKNGYTNPDAPTFSIVLPPPNVTGVLHLGHSFEDATQDALIRYHRMIGDRTLWIPGTDHAAIATQAKFEKEHYKKEKKSRHDYDRDTFFEMIQEFALENQSNILGQLKTMGASLDWSRLCFTLDETRQHAVYTAFKEMYDAGLIYRKEKVVNWDPKGQTTISDDEVVHEERKAKLYTFKYSADFPFAISTTRPETKLGDTAVAVHPEDERYKQYIGQTFTCEFAGAPISLLVIGDEEVDPEFGTGALGVTPAHSIADWEIGERHNLPMTQVINEYGKMMLGNETIINTKAAVARDTVVEWLRSENLLEQEEEIDQSVGTAERTGAIIEPLPKLQWWINVNKKFPYPHETLKGIEKGQEVSLKDLMLHAVSSNQVDIVPNRFAKVYANWIGNLRDWNISRQIIYGHRIPVWHKDDEILVSDTSPGDGWEQDTDTLDTWFSSGLWTFSTLGWPTATDDLAAYHPTSIVNPGYEILFFWVARMILMSTFLVGEIPFDTALVHGMLRDGKTGLKFSKSLNNGVAPEEMIEKYGIDALRMSLIVGTTPGQDVSFSEDKVKAYKKFANKLWNITRFILENTKETTFEDSYTYVERDIELITERDGIISSITEHFEKNRLHLASDEIYHYTWDVFADSILEESKTIFESRDTTNIASRKQFLLATQLIILKAVHPFMPFVTEEIYQSLPYTNASQENPLMVQKWPTAS